MQLRPPQKHRKVPRFFLVARVRFTKPRTVHPPPTTPSLFFFSWSGSGSRSRSVLTAQAPPPDAAHKLLARAPGPSEPSMACYSSAWPSDHSCVAAAFSPSPFFLLSRTYTTTVHSTLHAAPPNPWLLSDLQQWRSPVRRLRPTSRRRRFPCRYVLTHLGYSLESEFPQLNYLHLVSSPV